MSSNSNTISDQATAHDDPFNINLCQADFSIINPYPPSFHSSHPELDLFFDGNSAVWTPNALNPSLIKSRGPWKPWGQDQIPYMTFSDSLDCYPFPQQMDPAIGSALATHVVTAENTSMSSTPKVDGKATDISGRNDNSKLGSRLEPEESTAAPVKKRQSRKNKAQTSTTAEVKRNKVLRRNRVAASKCRLKKLEWARGLADKRLAIESENTILKLQLIQAQEQVTEIKKLIMVHAHCNEPAFMNWIKNETICYSNSLRPTFARDRSAFVDKPCPKTGGSSICSTQESAGSGYGNTNSSPQESIASWSRLSSRKLLIDFGKLAPANHDDLQSLAGLDGDDIDSPMESEQDNEDENESFASGLAEFVSNGVSLPADG